MFYLFYPPLLDLEQWITLGLVYSIKHRDKMYTKLKKLSHYDSQYTVLPLQLKTITKSSSVPSFSLNSYIININSPCTKTVSRKHGKQLTFLCTASNLHPHTLKLLK